MRKCYLYIPTIILLIAATLLPALPAGAQGYYTARSTVVGTGVRQTGTYVWEITGQTTSFDTDQSVFAMTRIFNIAYTDNFQFKHVLTGGNVGSRTEYSPIYYPHRRWWAEIYYWYEIGRLSAGNYQLTSYVNVDGTGFKQLKTANFTVGDNYYYGGYDNYDYDRYYYNNYDYNYYNRNYYSGTYKYESTQTGKNIRQTGSYSYEIVNPSTNFTRNESVYVLTKLSDIRDVDTFQIKHDLYLNGNSYNKTMESGVLRPNYNRWEYNHTWANFGPVTSGNHEIRVYIRINNGSYKLLDTKQISVGDRRDDYGCRQGDYDYRNRDGRDCYYRDGRDGRYSRNPEYSYSWTQLGNYTRNTGGNDYEVPNQKTTFNDNESVVALTKLTNIKGMDRIQLKHELYRDGSLYIARAMDIQYLRYRTQDRYYASSNFGRLSAGSYYVRVSISVNGEAFKVLDTKNLTVNRTYNQNDNGCNRDYGRNYNDGYYDRNNYYSYDSNNYWYDRNYTSYR